MSELISQGFLAPPAVLVLVGLIGALLSFVFQRFGIFLCLAASLALFVLAMPAVATGLLARAESGVPENPDFSGAQAIVVLGGDIRVGNGGNTPDSLGPLSLERVVMAAEAYRRLQLPVAVSGGKPRAAHDSLAALMRAALEQSFSVPVTWTQSRSRTTFEDALDTEQLLHASNISTVVVVTQAWHLPRALYAFERAGLHPIPWPAARTAPQARRIDDFLPSNNGLYDSSHALHELLGGWYYRRVY